MSSRTLERDRVRGALLGLAAGDALGTTLEFQPALDPFQPRVTEIVGGGPFNLPAGGWTDDTSMALCLATSLVEQQGFNARDQIERYVRWAETGYMSVTGVCFDIGTTTRAALARFMQTLEPFSGSTDPRASGNGSLMRLAPAALAAPDEATALAWCADSSRTTHAAPEAVDACRYYGLLIWRAARGAPKNALLAPDVGAGLALAPAVAAVAAGSFRAKQPPAIRGTGYVVDALEAALWAFAHSESFRDGAILAANLGQDADTTAAIYGQLAGAHYGQAGIPATWRAAVLWNERILALADGLFGLAIHGAPEPPS
jgi:ADP-ribosyl-[dinitrogen reductase] hydrolase